MNAPEHAIPIPGAAAVGSLPIDAICKSPSNPRRRIDDACLRTTGCAATVTTTKGLKN